jgi:DNA polymerase-1
MRHLTFSQPAKAAYPLCLLIPQIRKDDIYHAYMAPFGIPEDDLLVLDLHQGPGKKTPASEIKQYISEELVPVLEEMAVEYILVADADYFKILTKAAKVEAHLGYVMDCAYGPWKVAYVPNHRAIFYDPDKVKAKISQAITAVLEHRSGQYELPGSSIIRFAEYPGTAEEIEAWLERLIVEDRPLTCDVEAFSLKHHTSGIGTVSFCWNKHEGIAFPVDYVPISGATEAPFGMQVKNERIRKALASFFRRFRHKITYHNISYDAYILIYQLFMDHLLDTEGLLDGLEVMLKNWDCTKLITYLATNSCAGNVLKLKMIAQEFAGNWAQDEIHDITKIRLPDLLQYNLVDGLSTWYAKEKHWDTMVADQQLDIYESVFKPATIDIIQMQLTGMPVNRQRVGEVRVILQAIEDSAVARIQGNPLVQKFLYKLEERHIAKRNAAMKKKQITIGDEPQEFNPNSGPQLQMLLYEEIGLPVIAYTDSKQPSTDGDTLKALITVSIEAALSNDVRDLLSALIDYKAVNKLLTSFIPAMENAAEGPDGWHYLFGNFNLGGTLSGRLSSSDPNLQNLPANVFMILSAAIMARFGDELKDYISKGALSLGKLIKSCFEAPSGWLFCGLDFDSLEDKISGLTTKDPEKLKVYTDGYDGHCLRAYAYYREQMPDIVDTVVSINSIEKKYKDLRQESKVPTFALTYDGTFNTLMTKCGFTREKAQTIERRYKELYHVSIDWVSAKLDQACRDGYVTAAFGLRVRTPLLKQVVRRTRKTPYEAEAEGRSAGNALGQSWCLLNSRAGSEFMGKVRRSEHRLDIRPCSQIHDAQYYLIRDDIGAVLYANKHLVKAVEWQAHPDIAHPDVKLGGKLGIFYPSWVKEITIPNGADEAQIFALIAENAGQ